MRKLLALALALALLLLTGPAVAQNVTCAKRASGDNTNACATTSFVHDAVAGSSGTVTSVGLGVPATSIFGVTGSPVTTTGTLGFTTTGTSGGIPYFSSTSALSTSALLTANLPVIGGGAGSAPTVGTVSGNTTKFVTTTGSLSTGNCIKIDANGNFVDTGAACAGSATPGGATTNVQFNNAGAFGGSANMTWVSPTLTLGATGTTGAFAIKGTTSGTVTQTVQGTAGTPTITWGTGTGTPAVTVSVPLALATTTGNLTITGAAGQVLAGSTPAFTATPTLGASGTLGSLTFGNATSGTLKIQPVTGALGSPTLSLPAATDQLIGRATTDTLTNKTFDTAGAGNTFSINGNAISAVVGTGSAAVLSISPNLTTPTLGVATATSINALTLTPPATGSTITIADGKTLTYNNSITIAGTDTTTMTFPSTSGTIAALNVANQTVTGGANVTSLTQSTGNLTINCGARPNQFITNGGNFTLTAPAADGSCLLLVTNNASAGTITFSGFSVGTNTGDALTTTNTNTFTVFVWRINSVAGYRVAAMQ